MKTIITGPQRKFCEGIIGGKSATDAYAEAYPSSSREGARRSGPRLLTKVVIKGEIARLRAAADAEAGSAVLTLAEKRSFLARVVRARVATLDDSSDLWSAVKKTKDWTEYRLPDKLGAIAADNDLAGEGSEAEAQDALSSLLGRIRK